MTMKKIRITRSRLVARAHRKKTFTGRIIKDRNSSRRDQASVIAQTATTLTKCFDMCSTKAPKKAIKSKAESDIENSQKNIF